MYGANDNDDDNNNTCTNNNTHSNNNKDQRNSARCEIANRSFAFARLQHRTDGLAAICNIRFLLGLYLQISPSPRGQGPPSNTMCHWTHKCACQIAPKSVEWFKQDARM